jgi:hypothetical protein
VPGGAYRVVNADGSIGRLVSDSEIADYLREMYGRTDKQLAALAAAMTLGSITPSLFQRAMMEQLKNLHLSTAVLGAGGWDQADGRLYGRVGRDLREEYRYLARFTRQFEQGDVLPEMAILRAALYADNAYGQYQSESDRRMLRAGVQEEWLRTEPGACNLCLDAEAQGWVPLGTHEIPKHSNCRCHKEYRISYE